MARGETTETRLLSFCVNKTVISSAVHYITTIELTNCRFNDHFEPFRFRLQEPLLSVFSLSLSLSEFGRDNSLFLYKEAAKLCRKISRLLTAQDNGGRPTGWVLTLT